MLMEGQSTVSWKSWVCRNRIHRVSGRQLRDCTFTRAILTQSRTSKATEAVDLSTMSCKTALFYFIFFKNSLHTILYTNTFGFCHSVPFVLHHLFVQYSHYSLGLISKKENQNVCFVSAFCPSSMYSSDKLALFLFN